jgi:hypothetical protein
MKNIPNKIYLNLGLQKDSTDIDFNELSEITWSQDKVDADDIEYVRKEPVDWEARRFELVRESLKSILSDPECEITPDKLANSCVSVADAIIEKMKGGSNGSH